MDEVETIQNHLLSQAGDDTDVILGLGYDNALENKIGITLIATGFEHKDPFDKKEAPKVEKKEEEKIVMVLQHPEEDKKKYHQPVFTFDDKKAGVHSVNEIREEENIIEQKGFTSIKEEDVLAFLPQREAVREEMSPTIVEIPEPIEEKLQKATEEVTVDKTFEDVIHFTLSSDADSIAAEAHQPQALTAEVPQPAGSTMQVHHKEATTVQTSGGYLAKPSQIYAQDKPEQEPKTVEVVPPLQMIRQEDEPIIEMQLVVKDSKDTEEEKEKPKVRQAMPLTTSSVEEPLAGDETDELKRRAVDRIAKLRNLSFNVNATDPNNEFESVPAYLRRNMELHNSIADVESFYSNYTVKSDENNKAEISTINSFLEGKKPD